VLPSVAQVLGLEVPTRPGAVGLALPEAVSAVVVLVDGLGEQLLTARGGHAPFLRQLRAAGTAAVLSTGFPSTTATSMGMLGTGLLPGAHGMVGLDVLDPARDVLFSELSWDVDVDPRAWQPNATVFELAAAAGIDVVRIGPAYFDGSGLTEAALRGGRFVAAGTLAARVDAALAFGRRPRTLVYLYWGEVDKVGHVHGCGSWQWGEELAAVDAELRRLVAGLRSDTLVAITADHGMVDVPLTDRLDVAHTPELAAGVRHVGGEPRALHLYCVQGAAGDVLAAWRSVLDGRMEMLARDEAVRAGWFGPVAAHVLPRIGDVVASATSRFAVVDSRTARPEALRLLGLHGARTAAERLVPLLATSGGG
jgi:Type I phosphodiesterase / nucleotide pyrophosphatase